MEQTVARRAFGEYTAEPSRKLPIVGLFKYDKITASFDDRVLAHLQPVIWGKLRRGESFSFTWNDGLNEGSGRRSVWMTQGVPIVFEYFGSRSPVLNPHWVQVLTKSANSPSGLQLLPEPTSGQPE